MAQIPEHRHLMSHPTVTSFLWMKWRKIRRFFYFNLAFYLLFMGVMTAYVLQVNIVDTKTSEVSSSQSSTEETPKTTSPATTALFWTSLLLLIVLTLRELVQMALSYRRFLLLYKYFQDEMKFITKGTCSMLKTWWKWL